MYIASAASCCGVKNVIQNGSLRGPARSSALSASFKADSETDPDEKRRLGNVARELGGAAKSVAVNLASDLAVADRSSSQLDAEQAPCHHGRASETRLSTEGAGPQFRGG